MKEEESMIWAQASRDRLEPEAKEGKWCWCIACGDWREEGEECPRCRKRKARWEAMAGHEEMYLEEWLDGQRNKKEILLQAYEQQRRVLIERREWLKVLAMEQAEEEFAESCK